MSCKRQCVDPSERVISSRNVRDSTQGRSPESAASWVVVLHPMRNSAMLANSGDAHGLTTFSPDGAGCAEAFTHMKAPSATKSSQTLSGCGVRVCDGFSSLCWDSAGKDRVREE